MKQKITRFIFLIIGLIMVNGAYAYEKYFKMGGVTLQENVTYSTSNNINGIIKAGTVKLEDGKLYLKNAKLTGTIAEAILEYGHSSAGDSQEDATGYIYIDGKCEIQNNSTSTGAYGLRVWVGNQNPDKSYLKLEYAPDAQIANTELIIRTVADAAIYLHSQSQWYANGTFYRLVDLTINTRVTLYSPNHNAIRGRHGKDANGTVAEKLRVGSDGCLYIPGPCAKGMIVNVNQFLRLVPVLSSDNGNYASTSVPIVVSPEPSIRMVSGYIIKIIGDDATAKFDVSPATAFNLFEKPTVVNTSIATMAGSEDDYRTVYVRGLSRGETELKTKLKHIDITKNHPIKSKGLGLRIADIDVFPSNASNITGPGISGEISYNRSTNTLTLENATINAPTGKDGIFHVGNRVLHGEPLGLLDGLKIKLIGKNTITTTDAYGLERWYDTNLIEIFGPASSSLSFRAINSYATHSQEGDAGLSISGGCTVTFDGDKYGLYATSSGSHLRISNSTVKAIGRNGVSLGGFRRITLDGATLTQPANAYIGYNRKQGDYWYGVVDGQMAGNYIENQWIVIEPVTKYGLSVAGVEVTSENASAITGTGISGNVSYDAASHTLTLNNATITLSGTTSTVGIDSYSESGENLRIKLIGTNRINHTSTDLYGRGIYLRRSTRFTGTGSLNVYCTGSEAVMIHNNNTLTFEGGCTVSIESTTSSGLRGMPGSKLVVNNATLKARGADYYSIGDGFTSLSMTGVYISSPYGAAFNSTLGGVALNGSLVKGRWVTIEPGTPVTKYYIDVADIEVTSANASNITGAGISGTVSYDASSHTLTLNNATITVSGDKNTDGIVSYSESRENLKINLVGTNRINHTSTNSFARGIYLRKSTRFTGTGSLSIYRNDAEAIIIDNNKTLTLEGGCTVSAQSMTSAGLRGNPGSKLVVNNATLKARGADYYSIGDGFTSLSMTGVYISSPYGAAFSPSLGGVALNGSLVKNQWVTIEPGTPITKYYIDVGGVEVTSANASNITGKGITDGKVSYDAASHTLTLNNATISFADEIYAYGIDCTNFCAENLKINLIGTNRINHTGTDDYLSGIWLAKSASFTGTGSLTVYREGGDALLISKNKTLTLEGGCTVSFESTTHAGIRGDYGNKLVVNNSTLKAKGFDYSIGTGFISLSMTGVEITSPAGAYFNEGYGVVASNGALVSNQWVVIGSPTAVEYDVWVAGTRVTYENASDITGPGISGTVSYDHSTKTLTLNNAFIEIAEVQTQTDGIYVRDQDLQIKLIGYNRIENCGIGDGIQNPNGKLTISGASSSSLDIDGEQGGYMDGNCIYTTKDLTIDGCKVLGYSHLDAIKAGPSLYLKNGAELVAHCSGQASGVHYGVNVYDDIVMTGGSTLKASGDYAVETYYGIDTYPGALLYEGSSYNTLEQVSKLSMNGGTATKPYILISPIGTGLESLSTQGVKVYGAKSAIRISLDSDEHKYASIYNMTGALVKAAELEGKEITVSNIEPGIYIVRIGNAAEKVIVK